MYIFLVFREGGLIKSCSSLMIISIQNFTVPC